MGAVSFSCQWPFGFPSSGSLTVPCVYFYSSAILSYLSCEGIHSGSDKPTVAHLHATTSHNSPKIVVASSRLCINQRPAVIRDFGALCIVIYDLSVDACIFSGSAKTIEDLSRADVKLSLRVAR